MLVVDPPDVGLPFDRCPEPECELPGGHERTTLWWHGSRTLNRAWRSDGNRKQVRSLDAVTCIVDGCSNVRTTSGLWCDEHLEQMAAELHVNMGRLSRLIDQRRPRRLR